MDGEREGPYDEIYLKPWLFEDRVRLFSLLIEQTHLFAPLSPSSALVAVNPLDPILNSTLHDENLLFGFLIQFLWQAKSGRLQLSPILGVSGYKISDRSWWAGVNFFLSVVPLYGAQKAGWNPLLNAIRIVSDPALPAKFLVNEEGPCPHVIEHWSQYFSMIGDIRRNHITTCPSGGVLSIGSDVRSHLSQLMWNAHNASVKYAVAILKDELEENAPEEQLFGLGWASLVATFAENNPIVTTRSRTKRVNETMFPPRILKLNDDLSDLSLEQQEFVLFMQSLSRTSNQALARL